MQNLEQVRARNALRCQREDGALIVGPQGGEVIKKLPPLILNHGLLATAAYAYTQKDGWQIVLNHIARHLADADIAIVPLMIQKHEQLMDFLTGVESTSETLKLATLETMAWLSYARRFVRRD
jgi:CRISPR/Cas system CMR-associated protein Cmr5 small subunit